MLQKPVLKTVLLLTFISASRIFPAVPTGTLPCRVTEKLKGTAVPEADICLEEDSDCATTDNNGTATLKECPVGLHTLVIHAEGYDTLIIPNIDVSAGSNPLISITLSKATMVRELDKITISAKRYETKKADQIASVTRLTTFDLENTAGTINDVNRVLQTLPSVVAGGTDFDNSMVVRGGHTRENVFILDGMELDNISHFSDVGSSGGSFGFIDGSLLQSLDFYAGSIPASFPAKMSSVIDMTMREGSSTERHHQLHLNTSGIGFTTEGPFPGGRGSYILSGRYVDTRSVKDIVDFDGLPRFGDGQSKFTFPVDKQNKISLVSVVSYDNFQRKGDEFWSAVPSNYEYILQQHASGLQWNSTHSTFRNRVLFSYYRRNAFNIYTLRNFNGRLEISDEWRYNDSVIDGFILPDTPYVNVIHDRTSINRKNFFEWGDDRSTLQFKDDLSLYLRNNLQMKTGVTLSWQRMNCRQLDASKHVRTYYWLTDEPGKVDSATASEYNDFSIDSTVYDTSFGGYINLIFSHAAFKAVAGFRGDYWRLLRDYGLSPRCAFSYEFPSAGIFAVSGGLYYQQPSRLAEQIGSLIAPDPNYPAVRPSLHSIELQRSWQGVLSWEKQLKGSHHLTVEAYGKWYDREYPLIEPGYYEYQNDFALAMHEKRPWELKKPDGLKKTYGIELSFQKKQQHGIYYALGYSLSSVKNRYADDKWYNDPENVRNHGSLLLGIEFLRRHSISTRIYFSEGRPYFNSSFYAANGPVCDYYSSRLDPVCSVNLRYNFHFYPTFGTITGYVEAWNIFNYKPVVHDDENDYAEALGIIPFLGVTADF